MSMSPEEAARELSLEKAAVAYVVAQDERRGDWPRLRGPKMPNPPFPAAGNPMMAWLLDKALRDLKAGRSKSNVLATLAATCWLEGHVEGYDRAHRELGTGSSLGALSAVETDTPSPEVTTGDTTGEGDGGGGSSEAVDAGDTSIDES